jgi:hypothetical protein
LNEEVNGVDEAIDYADDHHQEGWAGHWIFRPRSGDVFGCIELCQCEGHDGDDADCQGCVEEILDKEVDFEGCRGFRGLQKVGEIVSEHLKSGGNAGFGCGDKD